MAKVTITFEDAETGVLIVSDPSLHDLSAGIPPKDMTLAQIYAGVAWAAIFEEAARAGGHVTAGNLN